MSVSHEQREKILPQQTMPPVDVLQRIGRSVVKRLDIIPQGGTHGYRDGIGQLRVEEISKSPESSPSPKAENTPVITRQEQGPPLTQEELTYQPLLTHQEHMPSPHRPSWVNDNSPRS